MRTETVTIYTAQELAEANPRGFARALDDHARWQQEDYDSSDDWHSLAELDTLVGYRRVRPRWGDQMDRDVANLSGKRALAWLENAVLGPLRIPWRGYVSVPLGTRRQVRTRYRGYPRGYRCGTVPPCPLTGYYLDDHLLESLREALVAGLNVGDAMLGLEAVVQKQIDADLEYHCSEEGFLEYAANCDAEFYADGRRA